MDLIKKYEQSLGKNTKDDTRLSTKTRQLGKPAVKESLFAFIKMLNLAISKNQPMTDIEIKMLVEMMYYDYYWMTISNLFDFTNSLIKGELGPIYYNTIDMNSFMEKLAKWDAMRNSGVWGTQALPPSSEVKLLNVPKKKKAPDYIIKLSHKLRLKKSKAFLKPIDHKKQTALEKLNFYLTSKCQLSEERAKQYTELVLEEWKANWNELESNSKTETTWEQFRDTTINKFLYVQKNQWRTKVRI